MRAWSNLLCFNWSIARSNRTLSGCLDPTLASGLETFLFVHAEARRSSSTPNRAIDGIRRDMRPTSEKLWLRVYLIKRCSCWQELVLNLQQRSLSCRLKKALSIGFWIAVSEHSVAGHKKFCASTHDIPNRIQCNAPIYLDAIVQPAVGTYLSQTANLLYHPGDELLAPEAGIH